DGSAANANVQKRQYSMPKLLTSKEPVVSFHIQFVCLGNICRSPMADVIFRDLAQREGVGENFNVTSTGIGNWHEGHGADPRTVAALERAGYDGSAHMARQVTPQDISEHDLFIALDRSHERELKAQGAKNVELLTDYDDAADSP